MVIKARIPKLVSNLEKLALTLCVLFVSGALLFPDMLTAHIQPLIINALSVLGGPFFLLVNFLLISVIVLAISPLGQRKIGGEHTSVEFSTFGWLSMLFAAGMGSGLIFWGVAEPAMHVLQPPLKQSLYPDRQGAALAITLVNWGAHAWALYAVFGLVLGGLSHNSGKAGDISAPVLSVTTSFLSREGQLKCKYVIQLVAILAIFFGVVGTIANSTLLLRKGIELELGINSPWLVGLIIIMLLALLFSLSARLGLKKGIQTLSQFNVFLAFGVLIWLIMMVPLQPIIDVAISGVKFYSHLLVTGTWQLSSQLNDPAWANSWTYNYYFWWLAWGPFVGVFLAKISQGRPVWQYIVGVVIVPTFVTLIWFSVFSGSAIAWDSGHSSGIMAAIKTDYTKGLFVFFKQLGWQGGVLIWSSLLLLLIFVATSADSAILVIRNLAGTKSSHRFSLYVWSFTLALSSWVLLLQNNELLNRSIAIIGAVPFLFIFILQLIGFVKEFMKELQE
ncbi:BCCT family transporter [Pseudoalteromonas sp. SR41-8]|uniref:BCCT family transporter n=1 Tax=Pseudoalteromonas sp. SR41-8 TaxID=2760946 RepID=UPI00287336A9|nr:BCCT family transporter [Pseudoalteromonas sp. SR41-8]